MGSTAPTLSGVTSKRIRTAFIPAEPSSAPVSERGHRQVPHLDPCDHRVQNTGGCTEKLVSGHGSVTACIFHSPLKSPRGRGHPTNWPLRG